MTPLRLQRSRRKGARLVSPNGLPVKCVTRPGVWGNPFPADVFGLETSLRLFENLIRDEWDYRVVGGGGPLVELAARKAHFQWRAAFMKSRHCTAWSELRHDLAGHNLACWCPLPTPGQPDQCHAAVLLRLLAERQCARKLSNQ